MKIGIITFHWGTNYGGVLQAYALQIFLTKYGHDVKIIDYKPARFEKTIIKCFLAKNPWVIKNNLLEYFKEKSFIPYREKYLNTTERYFSLDELKMNPPDFDVYICGSDQIWNPGFILAGEMKKTTTYYLDFGNEKIKRIAYAVSFGCEEYSVEVKRIVAPLLKKFDAISVREKSGCKIIHDMGYENACLMPDPSLLVSAEDYNKIIYCSKRRDISDSCFFYVIHDNQRRIKKIEKYFREKLNEKVVSTTSFQYSIMSIENWLLYIKETKIIITNSFHGIAFSLLFNKQFISVPVEGNGAGMNDRVITLLDYFNLKDRIIHDSNELKIRDLIKKQIDWAEVNKKIKILQKEARLYLMKAINNNMLDEEVFVL